MYSIFAMAMSLLGGAALTLALVIYLDARKSVSQNRHIMMHWCESVLAQQDSNRLLQQKIEQELAQRIKNLETFRVNHAHRLNTLEDLVDLLNSDGTVEIDHYSEGQGWDRVKVNISDLSESEITAARPERSVGDAEVIVDVQSEVRSEWDRARVLEDFELDVPAGDTLLRQWDNVTPANPTDPNPLDAEMQAIVERRFLQGL
jgi:hypothetical protein